MRVFLTAIVWGGLTCASAQPGDLKLPSLGFAYDPGQKAIRAIHGIPGAASLGEGVSVGLEFSYATVSPTQDFAIAAVTGDPQPWLVRLSETPTARRLDRVTTSLERGVFSSSGGSVILAGAGLQVVSGLPESPLARDVAAPAGGPWSVMAVTDDGKAVLLADGKDPADPVWLVSAEGALQVPISGSVAVAAFRRQSKDAVLITKAGDVYLIRSADRDLEIRQLYPGDDRTADPVAVYFAADGQRAYAASRSGRIAAIDIPTASVVAISCQCAPVMLMPIHAGTLFRLTDISDSPVMLVDTREAVPRRWFVPADGPAGPRRRER